MTVRDICHSFVLLPVTSTTSSSLVLSFSVWFIRVTLSRFLLRNIYVLCCLASCWLIFLLWLLFLLLLLYLPLLTLFPFALAVVSSPDLLRCVSWSFLWSPHTLYLCFIYFQILLFNEFVNNRLTFLPHLIYVSRLDLLTTITITVVEVTATATTFRGYPT